MSFLIRLSLISWIENMNFIYFRYFHTSFYLSLISSWVFFIDAFTIDFWKIFYGIARHFLHMLVKFLNILSSWLNCQHLFFTVVRYLLLVGAAAANIDSILVTADGVHRDELSNSRSAQELTNYGNDIRYAASTNNMGVQQPLQKSLISKVCDLCDREKTARPTFILEHCTYWPCSKSTWQIRCTW